MPQRYVKPEHKHLIRGINEVGNISATGSVKGMQTRYPGAWKLKGQLRVGAWIYNVGPDEVDRLHAAGILHSHIVSDHPRHPDGIPHQPSRKGNKLVERVNDARHTAPLLLAEQLIAWKLYFEGLSVQAISYAIRRQPATGRKVLFGS